MIRLETRPQRPQVFGSTILVTGGAGFIGSFLVDRLIAEGAKEVIVVDNMFLGDVQNLQSALREGVILYKDDIEINSTLSFIFDTHNVDIVFNCATKALNYSFVNPRNAFDTNTQGVLNLLEHQRKGCFQTLVHFSTSEVYGSAIYEPMDEKHPFGPTTTYAAGKAAADHAIASYVNMYKLDAFIMRPFNNYGPRQNHKGYMAGIIPITIWRVLNAIPPEIHGDGRQSRDFIYIEDTINSIIQLYPILNPAESINISADSQYSVREVISMITQQLDYQGEIIQKPSRNADVVCHRACNRKLKSMINFELTEFSEGLARTIQWYQGHIK